MDVAGSRYWWRASSVAPGLTNLTRSGSECHFWANQFRLLLHAAASWLLDTVRRWLGAMRVARMQLDTLRLRLLKIGGRVWQRADHVCLRLAASHPGQPLWGLLVTHRRLRE